MKPLMILTCFFYGIFSARAQGENDYFNTALAAFTIPNAQTNTTTDIASYIGQHFDSNPKKIRAIYAWVTTNIKYDTDSIHQVILDEDREEKVTFALRRKKGVCENFAAIFNDICLKSRIPSYVIEGYTKQNGSIDRAPHAWCVAFINNKWSLYDPTWDAGFINNTGYTSHTGTRYFQASPEDFIQTHMPFDPLFQFLNYPVTYKEFLNGNTVNSHRTYFNFNDSLLSYEKMDSLTRYLSALARIKKNGVPVAKTDIKMKQINLEIELIYQDRDMAYYNEAVADYNVAITIFNNFINYRNNQFQPVKKETEVQEMFTEITGQVNAANAKLAEVNRSKATLALDTGDIQKKLDDLTAHVKEQQLFLKNYLSESKNAN